MEELENQQGVLRMLIISLCHCKHHISNLMIEWMGSGGMVMYSERMGINVLRYCDSQKREL